MDDGLRKEAVRVRSLPYSDRHPTPCGSGKFRVRVNERSILAVGTATGGSPLVRRTPDAR